jgi:hypothetical protein
MPVLTIKDLEHQQLIIFEAVMGSTAYGTNTPESDVDIRGIYIQPLESILGMGYVDQVSDSTNDTTYYEIRRFLELLQTNNPNILELLAAPADCIRIQHDIMDVIFSRKDELLSKKCRWSFGGYAMEQIKKARGLGKKMNWEEGEMTRKTVLDFCYILKSDGNGSIPVKEWIEDLNEKARVRLGKNFAWEWTQKSYGLSKIDHAKDCYGIYDIVDEPEFDNNPDYAGIVSDEEIANDVQLTSFSKNAYYKGVLVFNKDGYSSHCKRYKEYQTWLIERNPIRVQMNKDHGKKYDGKNMLHCLRLLTMANEILDGKGIIVRRSPEEVTKLLSIKRGEYDFEDLMSEAELLLQKMDAGFESCSLQKEVNPVLINYMLTTIRKDIYGL